MPKVLHISHHYGCLKDHQYICDSLGIDLTSIFTHWCNQNTVIPKGYFRTTKELADSIWNKGKDYFNQFEVIIVSDTSPLCRIFLQNIEEVVPKIIVWVCNRFDYDVENDFHYSELLNSVSTKYYEKVTLIPYTEFERLWLNRKGIVCRNETIRPIGISVNTPIGTEEFSIGFDGKDYEMAIKTGDVLVSRYHNDQIFHSSKSMCEKQGISAETLKFRGSQDLKQALSGFSCYLALPDAYSKFIAFELMQTRFPVIVPSKSFLMRLHKTPGYHYSTGLWENTVSLCEWYNEYYSTYAVYIDSFDEMKKAVSHIQSNKEMLISKIEKCANFHRQKTLNSWKNVYSSLLI